MCWATRGGIDNACFSTDAELDPADVMEGTSGSSPGEHSEERGGVPGALRYALSTDPALSVLELLLSELERLERISNSQRLYNCAIYNINKQDFYNCCIKTQRNTK